MYFTRGIFVWFMFFFCMGCHDKVYDNSYEVENDTITDKVWAHRINTVENNQHKFEEFKGIEIDVFFEPEKGRFVVKHDIKEDGPELNLFLDSVLNLKNVPIWIDYKNMNVETEYGIDILEGILKQKDIIKQCFVESYYLGSLRKAKGRFTTSYWSGISVVPESRAIQDSLYNKHYKGLDITGFNMLSANHNMFEFFTYYFPQVKCNYWLNGAVSESDKERVKTIASFQNTHVILIDGDVNYVKE